MAEGEFVLAREHLTAAADRPIVAGGYFVNDTQLSFLLAELAVLEQDEAALRLHAPVAASTAERDGHELYQASAQRALGVLHRLTGDYGQAEKHLLRALQMFEGLKTRWQIGRTLAELAALAARTDSDRARAYYVRAAEAFEEMGALPDLQRVQKALESLA